MKLLSEKVISNQQKTEFENIWYYVCDIKGFEREDLKPDADQFFLLDKGGGKVGTLEFNSFDFNDITKVDYFARRELALLGNKVIEIDKVAIFPEHHSIHNLNRLLALIVFYLKIKNTTQGVALLEPKFFRLLEKFGVTRQIGYRREYKGDDVIPSHIFIDKSPKKVNSVLKNALRQKGQYS